MPKAKIGPGSCNKEIWSFDHPSQTSWDHLIGTVNLKDVTLSTVMPLPLSCDLSLWWFLQMGLCLLKVPGSWEQGDRFYLTELRRLDHLRLSIQWGGCGSLWTQRIEKLKPQTKSCLSLCEDNTDKTHKLQIASYRFDCNIPEGIYHKKIIWLFGFIFCERYRTCVML